MNIILLSGGSGKRLWPLSNDTRSKQFLRVLKNAEGKYQSMVERVYAQIKITNRNSKIVIATGQNQISSIKNQLGDSVDISVEPSRRDTFPAIALAGAYLKDKKNCKDDEVVIVCPVDPFVDNEYFMTLQKLEQAVLNDKANLVLMGVVPTYPSEKYGYIIPKSPEQANLCQRVERFTEKPTEKEAEQFIENGALWNCGVFAFRLSYLLEIIKQQVEFKSFDDLSNKYEQLTKTSFDYAVVEKESSMGVIKYDGMWKDLGTWNTLSEEMAESSLGNVIIGDNCQNTNVVNELEIPILTMGLNNIIVSASADGILVADKKASSYIKPYVDKIEQRVMFEERAWGSYKVLSMSSFDDGTKSLTKKLMIKKGKSISYQLHHSREEIWTITTGLGEFILNDYKSIVKAGDVLRIPSGAKHKITGITDLEFIEVQIGKELAEEDIERIG